MNVIACLYSVLIHCIRLFLGNTLSKLTEKFIIRIKKFFVLKKTTVLVIILSGLLGYASPKVYSPFFLLGWMFHLWPMYLLININLGIISYLVAIMLYLASVSFLLLAIAIFWEPLFEIPIAYNSFVSGAMMSVWTKEASVFQFSFLFMHFMDILTCTLGLYFGLKINSPNRIIDREKRGELIPKDEIFRRIRNASGLLFYMIVIQMFSSIISFGMIQGD